MMEILGFDAVEVAGEALRIVEALRMAEGEWGLGWLPFPATWPCPSPARGAL
jgi:hypothetical protein